MIPGILLILVALCAESFAVWLFLQSSGEWSQVLTWHLLASLPATGGLWAMLPPRYRQPPVAVPVFLLVICACLPGLGAAGLLLVMVPALRHPRNERRIDWRVVKVPDLPYKPLAGQAEQYGPGGLMGVLRNAPDSERRLRAVISTRQMHRRAAVPILREALQDPVDDVRLLAYALLDDQQDAFTVRIREQLSALEKGGGERATLQANAASAYWELAYLGLAEPELRAALLSSAEEHLLEALAERSEDGDLYFLLGRVQLLSGRLGEADDSLRRAMDHGLSRNEVLPYLAEVAFMRHDFVSISSLLGGVDPVKLRDQRLSPVADYWL